MKKSKNFLIILICCLFFGCDFAPKLKTPKVELPSKKEFLKGKSKDFKLSWGWWKVFHNSELNRIIELAIKNNDDLKIATARLEEVMAFYGLKKSELYPIIGYNLGIARTKIPERIEKQIKGIVSGFALLAPGRLNIPTFKNPQNSYNLLSSVSFELDFWGKLRNAKKAALHKVLATKAARETLKITLISTIIELYYTDVAIQKELKIVENIEKNLKDILAMQKEKEKLGLITKVDIYKTKNAILKIKSLKEDLEKGKRITELMISFLIGESPDKFFKNGLKITGDIPEDLKIPAMLPSDVLLRRPDIIQAEEELKAANFEIGVARAMYFPDINLTGYFGSLSSKFKDLIESNSFFWQIGAGLKGPIWDFGRTKAIVNQAKARKKEALLNYIKTVKNAFKEVYKCFLEVNYENRIFNNSLAQLNNMQKILNIIKFQYNAGIIDKTTFLSIKNTYLELKLNLIQSKLALFKGYVKLYKALGGGINFSCKK